jgi:hypothetical protein
MTKEWRDIPGWEGTYQISNEGAVMRLAGSPYCRTNRILSSIKSSAGYFYVNFTNSSEHRHKHIHRLIALAFLEPQPTPKHEINHINGIKTDNRPENLEWVTRSQNIKHAFDTGLHPIKEGINASNAKLTQEDLDRIVAMTEEGAKPKEIATQLGIKYCSVICFLYGRTHVNAIRPHKAQTLKGARALDRQKVLEIKKALVDGEMSSRQIAVSFGVSKSTVQHIKKGRMWADVNL